MSDGTLSTEIDNSDFVSSSDNEGYEMQDQSDAETARLVAQSGSLADADFMGFMQDAAISGVNLSFLDTVQSGLGLVGKGVGAVSDWVKQNPEISKMLTGGLGTAMKQKSDRETLELKNQFNIDAENRKNTRDDALWERKNQSVVGMQPANLGLIGKAMYGDHINYLQNRK